VLWLVAGCLAAAVSAASASAASCSPKQAEAAEAAADQLTDWSKVAAYYRDFQACDDGVMAEGSSEAVARLLVDKWSTLPELAVEIRRQPGLKPFVLSHINATLDTGDIQTIRHQAARKCPEGEAALCSSIHGAVAQGLD